jgi:signal transduction histidine kinase
MAGVGVLESRREELSPRSIIALNLLVADLERFNRLVNDLLEISGFDAGVAALDLTEVGIARFLEVTAANAGAVALRMPDDAHRVVVQADKRRLARIMSNLLDNAGRYGGGATAITLEIDDTLRISVEDDGAGIPIGERSAVFERFFRGSAGGRRTDDGGTGLGLSLVVEDLRLHDGRVWVEDRPDGRRGARFVLQLPLPEGDA